MTTQHSQASPSDGWIGELNSRTTASYEHELFEHRCTETLLRQKIAQDEAMLRQKDDVIQQQDILSKESDHRLLNGMQIVASLLSMQSRAAANEEVVSQLGTAARRIGIVAHIHRHLHNLDGAQTVAFKQYIEGLCQDYADMWSTDERPIVVEGAEIVLPTATGIPLGYIANELITNAVKYGKGLITVRLETISGKGYALSVTNDGPALPEGYDPAASTGLGMKIIRSLVKAINGELQIERGENNQGARFTVLFS